MTAGSRTVLERKVTFPDQNTVTDEAVDRAMRGARGKPWRPGVKRALTTASRLSDADMTRARVIWASDVKVTDRGRSYTQHSLLLAVPGPDDYTYAVEVSFQQLPGNEPGGPGAMASARVVTDIDKVVFAWEPGNPPPSDAGATPDLSWSRRWAPTGSRWTTTTAGGPRRS